MLAVSRLRGVNAVEDVSRRTTGSATSWKRNQPRTEKSLYGRNGR